MTKISWFYTWNSKDEVFHHILKSCFEDADEYFLLHDQKVTEDDDRFSLAAKYMLTLPENQLLVISDANYIIDNTQRLHEYFQSLVADEHYDFIATKDDSLLFRFNPSILLVRNTQQVREYINNLETQLNPGNLKYTVFQTPLFCDSKFHLFEIMKSLVLHLISFEPDHHDALFDKLNVASGLIDITPLEPLIPYDIWNRLIDEHKEANTNLPIMYFNYKSKPWQVSMGSQT